MATGMGEDRYLTAREAAGELDISTATLYAYVSRGLIRSEATGGKRRDRRYRAEDVSRLRELLPGAGCGVDLDGSHAARWPREAARALPSIGGGTDRP